MTARYTLVVLSLKCRLYSLLVLCNTHDTPLCMQGYDERIRAVFTKHIAEEVVYKEKELANIEVLDAKVQLHRTCCLVILSQEYGLTLTGSGSGEPSESQDVERSESTASWRDFEQQFISAC